MSTGKTGPDCGHLDEDAECLEDPVHCGDARHQHDAHQPTALIEPDAAAATEEPAQA